MTLPMAISKSLGYIIKYEYILYIIYKPKIESDFLVFYSKY